MRSIEISDGNLGVQFLNLILLKNSVEITSKILKIIQFILDEFSAMQLAAPKAFLKALLSMLSKHSWNKFQH